MSLRRLNLKCWSGAVLGAGGAFLLGCPLAAGPQPAEKGVAQKAHVTAAATPNQMFKLVTSTQIDLAWDDASSAPNEDGFEVERAPSLTGAFVKVGRVAQDVAVYSDNGLTAGTQYCYRVRAFAGSDAGMVYSDYSNTACGSTLLPDGGTVTPAGDGGTVSVDAGNPDAGRARDGGTPQSSSRAVSAPASVGSSAARSSSGGAGSSTAGASSVGPASSAGAAVSASDVPEETKKKCACTAVEGEGSLGALGLAFLGLLMARPRGQR